MPTDENETTAAESRGDTRSVPLRIELVTVYRDRLDLPERELRAWLEQRAEAFTIFSVVGVVRDVSAIGLGLAFEGQQLMASNLLSDGEHYVLKLTMPLLSVPEELERHLRREGSYCFLLLRAACRWHQPARKGISRAGFELLSNNAPEIIAFVRDRLQDGAMPVSGGSTI